MNSTQLAKEQNKMNEQIVLERVVKYFVYATFINLGAAIIFTVPIFLPRLQFPILLTEWPGIYIYIAYSAFLIAGVLGMLAWAVAYYLLWKVFNKESCDKKILLSQILITNIGVYIVSGFMFAGGYQGAFYAHEDFAAFIVGKIMEATVIPSAIGIALALLGNVFGLANIFFMLRAKN
ncbi:MAG: hypothetical protein FJ358_00555 [Thaumarchaeota archaeon]|nr:hypothetical protein [Nitrososphaerota archaeon]